MVKEPHIIEQEEISELSKKTLRAYGSKAIRASLSASVAGDDAKAKKRADGVNRASAKVYPSQYTNSPLKAKVPASESAEWPVYARILEKSSRDEHYKGATPPEKMDDNMSPKEKQFAAAHGGLGGNPPPPFVDDNVIDKAPKPSAVVKKAPLNKAPGSQ